MMKLKNNYQNKNKLMKKIKTSKKRILIDCLNKFNKLLFQKIKVF